MSIATKESSRRPLPTWRLLTRGGTDPDMRAGGIEIPSDESGLAEKASAFKQNPTFFNAYELYLTAYQLSNDAVLRQALEFIKSHPKTPKGFVSRLTQSGRQHWLQGSDGLNAEWVRSGIQSIRARLRIDSDNPLLQLDLAWLYSSIGESDRAYKAASISASRCHGSRTILRRASRFFAHHGDYFRAHAEVAREARRTSDPWLVSAELSFAQVCEIRSEWEKHIRKHLRSKQVMTPARCEMAASLGTLEAERGNAKSAIRMINLSLAMPDDNILAQAYWLNEQNQLARMKLGTFDLSNAYEASARRASHDARWNDCLDAVEAWISEEPYSSRPYAFGSYITAVAQGDFKLSLQYAMRGLGSNKGDEVLVNNLLVASLMLGREVEDVSHVFRSLVAQLKESKSTSFATAGLLMFALGDSCKGRHLYKKAVDLFERAQDPLGKCVAQLFWAQSEKLFGDSGRVDELSSVDKRMVPKSAIAIIEAMERRVQQASFGISGERPSRFQGRGIPVDRLGSFIE